MALSCCTTGGSLISNNLHFECNKIPKKFPVISPTSSPPNGFDIVDNPNTGKDISFESSDLFNSMQCEKNRWDSFANKWPLTFINIKELVESGFFYLQSDDKVQCAFCKLILHNWKPGDKPLDEHFKSSHLCPFLKKRRIFAEPTPQQCLPFAIGASSFSPSSKPRNPSMSDLRMRLSTFKNWPHHTIKVKDLAECGLYYTGLQDAVTCFHCGGSLSNWEPTDEPIVEHAKFYPKCDYLRVIQNRPFCNRIKSAATNIFAVTSQNGINSPPSQLPARDFMKSDIVRKAKEIFPPSMVDEVVTKHLRKGEVFSSLHHLCEKLLQHSDIGTRPKQKVPDIKNSTLVQRQESISASSCENGSGASDVLLCKICMDSEREVVFQPCGHLISCEKCAIQLTKCPLCRKHIVSTMRTFLS